MTGEIKYILNVLKEYFQ